jgi:Holliday junction resolvase-like predicted endonuclease
MEKLSYDIKTLVNRAFRHKFGVALNKQALLGSYGEAYALRYLKTLNFVLWEKNWRIKHGELDLIGRVGQTLIIVEVKTRLLAPHTSIEDGSRRNYTTDKHRKVTDLAELYIEATRVRQSRERVKSFRVDLVALDLRLVFGFLPKKVALWHVEGVNAYVNVAR